MLDYFMWHHHTNGQQSKDVQNAIYATLTAACFALPEEAMSFHNIASGILGTVDASVERNPLLADLSHHYLAT
jgi:hypothetical protein